MAAVSGFFVGRRCKMGSLEEVKIRQLLEKILETEESNNALLASIDDSIEKLLKILAPGIS